MRWVVLVCALGCWPTEEDVRQASDDAVSQCRDVIHEEVPAIVSQVTQAALEVCSALISQGVATQAIVRENREAIAYAVLTSLGCSWDGVTWDCSTAPLLCGAP